MGSLASASFLTPDGTESPACGRENKLLAGPADPSPPRAIQLMEVDGPKKKAGRGHEGVGRAPWPGGWGALQALPGSFVRILIWYLSLNPSPRGKKTRIIKLIQGRVSVVTDTCRQPLSINSNGANPSQPKFDYKNWRYTCLKNRFTAPGLGIGSIGVETRGFQNGGRIKSSAWVYVCDATVLSADPHGFRWTPLRLHPPPRPRGQAPVVPQSRKVGIAWHLLASLQVLARGSTSAARWAPGTGAGRRFGLRGPGTGHNGGSTMALIPKGKTRITKIRPD